MIKAVVAEVVTLLTGKELVPAGWEVPVLSNKNQMRGDYTISMEKGSKIPRHATPDLGYLKRYRQIPAYRIFLTTNNKEVRE